jgi:hypothetical protein
VNLVVLYLKYDVNDYRDTFQILLGNLSNLNCNITFVDIDNKFEDKKPCIIGDVHLIPGCNKNWEFSGWQSGLNYVNENLDYDLILFANDSCVRSGKNLVAKKIDNTILGKIYNNNYFFGNTNGNRKHNFLFDGKSLNNWVRTDSFILTKHTLECVQKIDFSSEIDIDNLIFDGMNLDDFLGNERLNEFAKSFLVNWLTKRWHKRFNIMENIDLFRNKTNAILNERLLTYYVTTNGFQIVSN